MKKDEVLKSMIPIDFILGVLAIIAILKSSSYYMLGVFLVSSVITMILYQRATAAHVRKVE